ncbi:transcription-repair coupling factor [Kribbella solani]|uniref:transcription-repair coupling factor n=1 Tax=Kribbella solani TaxID=236067 RepID=UPI0029A2F20A|nr:transcription-repair coupling factor [Kribbella solani]MDX2971402.1 transcription-repair coupling factor [Kribbella solani]MDX3004153.1 transcription-repair coupling factor [Kribbella solani]
MKLRGLVDTLITDPVLAGAVRDARGDDVTTLDLSAPGPVRPVVLAALAASRNGADRPVLAVTATFREAEELTEALQCLVEEPSTVVYYPAWETLPHERLSPRSDTVGRRLAVLRRLVHPDPSDETTGPIKILVAPVRSVLQPQVAGLADLKPVQLHVGDSAELEDVVERLAGAAYHRVDLVERRGEFAVRGGIIDVFPPTEEHPLRVDFFGDDVEEIRYFAVADQRSLDAAEHGLWAPPCRELLLTDEVRSRAAVLAKEHPELAELFEKLAEGHAVEGMESLAPVLVDNMELLVDLMPAGTHVVVSDPERVRARAHDLVATSQEFLEASWAAAAGGGEAPIDLGAAAYMSLGDVRSQALGKGLAWWSLSPFAAAPADATTELRDSMGERIAFDIDTEAGAVSSRILAVREVDPYRGETGAAAEDIRGWLRNGWRVVCVTEGHGPAQRLAEVFSEAELPARLVDEIAGVPEPGVVLISQGQLEQGFVAEGIKFAVLTENDLSGQRSAAERRSQQRMPSRRKKTIDPLELQPGDHVVHEQHGVGRYVEMMQRTVGSGSQKATREYVVIEFAASKRGQPGDRLYVPTDQLDQVTRYVGGEQPTLDKMGGGDWAKRKGRARKAVRQIAGELIKLYAARQATKGHAFAKDTPWQRELEDAFPFVETPDQLATIDDVKHDMERITPMDRIVCGDVGYGKTEIAVRAAFKAVQDGKQVAVLVPTTLLVQQHYATFAERYAAFPVNVAPLSRFQTDKESKAAMDGLADGSIDVVIGTHRLLSGEMQFKDLGLVIVDEEQRFGVEHKEQLKRLRTAVDVLTMSATPIPRTLEMSITGIREMSTIATPPEERHPVLTFVGAYDEHQVTAAIRRELLREGQVFVVHNRVNTIEKAAARIRQLVPEARVSVAHGQMNEHTLENVIQGFWEKQSDVIVCTTIVESGIDISNANTMIVERSDLLGLSQLHQLRGRVGRGRERAYAYFFFPPEKPLTETAHDRLATIAQHADLGGGMAVAMKDLEIRGAGNLLGGEQSGHIADVGFDLYVRLVGEAVAEYRGDTQAEEPEVKIELPIDAHLPHDYIPSQRLRLEMYQRLAAVRDADAIAELVEELHDRYGDIPAAVLNLIEVAKFRNHARRAGLHDVTLQGNLIRFGPVELPDSKVLRLNRLYPKSLVKPQLHTILVPRPATRPIGGQPLRDQELLQWCTRLIDDVIAEPIGVPA